MDMTHTRVSAVPVKERKDECQMLRMTYSGGKKGKKRKLNVGVTFTALPAQVSIRWASELALKIPTSPLSELMATIAHSYGASDGRRQKMKAVVLVPFPAQKPTVISWGTTADPGQCQPGAADCFPAVFYDSPKHHEITWFFSLRITIQRRCHSPAGAQNPMAQFVVGSAVSRGSGTQSGPIRSTTAPCLPRGSRHGTAPNAPAELSVPPCPVRCPAEHGPPSSASSPQGFNCPSERLWVSLAAVSTSLFICREEGGEGQLRVGVMWFLSQKTPGRAQDPGRAVRADRCTGAARCSAGRGIPVVMRGGGRLLPRPLCSRGHSCAAHLWAAQPEALCGTHTFIGARH